MKKQLIALGVFLALGIAALPSFAACPCQSQSYYQYSSPSYAFTQSPCCKTAQPCCPAVKPCCPAVKPCCPAKCPCEAMPCPAAPIQEPCCNKPTYNDCSD